MTSRVVRRDRALEWRAKTLTGRSGRGGRRFVAVVAKQDGEIEANWKDGNVLGVRVLGYEKDACAGPPIASGGNVSALIEAIALEAERQEALDWLLHRAPPIDDRAFEAFMKEMAGLRKKRARRAA